MKSADAETDNIRCALAQVRVRRAMTLVEEAQQRLNLAMAELSGVQYGAPAMGRVGRLYDKVKAEWYRLGTLHRHPRIRIDRDPTNEERAFHAPKGTA